MIFRVAQGWNELKVPLPTFPHATYVSLLQTMTNYMYYLKYLERQFQLDEAGNEAENENLLLRNEADRDGSEDADEFENERQKKETYLLRILQENRVTHAHVVYHRALLTQRIELIKYRIAEHQEMQPLEDKESNMPNPVNTNFSGVPFSSLPTAPISLALMATPLEVDRDAQN